MQHEGVQLLIIVSSLALLMLVIVVITLFLLVQKKKVEFLLERKSRESLYQEELMNARAEVSEQTFRNIGWELHDNIGQLLSVANLKLGMMIASPNVEAASDLMEIKTVVGETLAEVRQLSKSLNRDYLAGLSLVETIKTEIQRYNKLRFFESTIKVSGDEMELDKRDRLIIFRILQEHFSNVIKHASASALTVQVRFETDKLYIEVEDDGKGFDLKNVKRGVGLFNMRNRATLIGAELKIDSKLGKGVSLMIQYPYKGLGNV